MAGGEAKRLTKEEVQVLLERLNEKEPRAECWQCECLQGFIAQLELDATEDARPLLTKYKVTPRGIRASSGCEPCPPADIFAEYLMRKREKSV